MHERSLLRSEVPPRWRLRSEQIASSFAELTRDEDAPAGLGGGADLAHADDHGGEVDCRGRDGGVGGVGECWYGR